MIDDAYHLEPLNDGPGPERRESRRWAEWLDHNAAEADLAPDAGEPVTAGATLLLELVAAVDHLRRGLRPGFTVWDALEEALRWHVNECQTRRCGAPAPDSDGVDPDDPDPLRTQLTRLVAMLDELNSGGSDEVIQRAIRRWSTTMSRFYNAGHAWAHPTPRHGFPPVTL